MVSGSVDANRNARVTIRGGGALRGTLRITAKGAVSGKLGGRRVAIAASAAVRTTLPTVASVLAKPKLLARR